jgi:hypothetical protein
MPAGQPAGPCHAPLCRPPPCPLRVLQAVRTYGLLGLVRLWSPEHRIVELKPQDSLLDLRVTHPWPALRSFADGIDLAACDDMTHRHVPYVALLLKALDAWRAAVRPQAAPEVQCAAQLHSPRLSACQPSPPFPFRPRCSTAALAPPPSRTSGPSGRR